jgi:hypothetical protein
MYPLPFTLCSYGFLPSLPFPSHPFSYFLYHWLVVYILYKVLTVHEGDVRDDLAVLALDEGEIGLGRADQHLDRTDRLVHARLLILKLALRLLVLAVESVDLDH